MSNYNSSSPDAMFASILSRLDEQDRLSALYRGEMRDSLKFIKEQCVLTNGRVTGLEAWRAGINGRITGLTLALSAVFGAVSLLVQWLAR